VSDRCRCNKIPFRGVDPLKLFHELGVPLQGMFLMVVLRKPCLLSAI
jgi:hypothetical protein